MEALAALKEFMQGLPKELEKKKGDIKKCMLMYDNLDEFHYKFQEDEEYEKMWKVYGAPIEVVQTIDKQ
jgi:seryl-tRNA synthetase